MPTHERGEAFDQGHRQGDHRREVYTLNDTSVTASASGLPDSASTVLPADTPVTAGITVTNNGDAPEAYFVDPRLSTPATISLAPQVLTNLPLPDVFGIAPSWLVPSQTTSITATATATKKLFFDLNYAFADPDAISTTGTTATATMSATPPCHTPAGACTCKPAASADSRSRLS